MRQANDQQQILAETDAGHATPVSARHHALGLDALRGLAALIVVTYHIGLANHVRLAPLGYLAVDFFFMLSGFVVALAYEPKLASGRLRPEAFIRLRLLRMYPAVLFGVATGIVLRLSGAIDDGALTIGALLALAMLPDLAATWFYPINNPMWSLFYEVSANVVHPFAIRRMPLPLLVALVIACGLGFVAYGRLYGQLNTGWGAARIAGGFLRIGYGYLYGVMVCRLLRRDEGNDRARLRWFPGWAAPLLVLLLAVPWSAQIGKVERLLVITACPLALLCGIRMTVPTGLDRVYRGLGHVSYPIYAIHMPLVQWGERRLPHIGEPGGGAIWVGVFIGLVVLALAVERWWERPLRTWLRGRAPNG